ncbi:MAG: HAD family hydrolase [Candidatus Liptonbacteria bacterium]|nr:HAD family hydrolase [Candidatus Liptonbacteria bacterium]
MRIAEPPVSGIIFDFDGVMADTIPKHEEFRSALAADFPGMNPGHAGKNAITELRALGFSNEKIEEYLRGWQECEVAAKIKIFPGMNELLSALNQKGVFCGALTNRGPRPHNLRLFKDCGLELQHLNFFVLHKEGVLPSLVRGHESCIYDKYSDKYYCLTPYCKPDPLAIMPVYRLLSRLPGFPESLYYAGDSKLDLKFTKNVGIRFIGTLSGNVNDPDEWLEAGLDELNGDIIVGNIAEISQMDFRTG